MRTSWLYELDTLWIVVGLLVAMALAGEIGSSVGNRWQPRADAIRREHIGSILGSLLGLLALLLGFTFAMTAARYDTRRQLVVNEANALWGLFEQSDLLSEASRAEFKQLLGKYVAQRATVARLLRDRTDSELAEDEARSESIQEQMWSVLKGAAEDQKPAAVAASLLDRLIDAAALRRERHFAWESRVPDSIVWLLLFGALTVITVLGFFGGLGNHRGLPARIAVTLLLCGTIYVTLDLDKPHQGLITVSQSPMLHLEERLNRDTESKG
ncbi:MAG TPA: hypothetical protein VEX43_08555 [Chthoniobacterales bacterium]|nr:hypothetical protein [Chthoniobacterales bacterium]